MGRFLDESIIDELEREGFFKKIAKDSAEMMCRCGAVDVSPRQTRLIVLMTLDRNTGWDEEADVVILGCGGAGAVAAITASDAGAKVIVVEKARRRRKHSACYHGFPVSNE